MSLSLPRYIPVADISRHPVKHPWSDRDPYELLREPDEAMMACLEGVSNRGIAAFAVGCAEWVVGRFAGQVDGKFPAHFLEASWAFLMGAIGQLPPAPTSRDFRGPIRGPIGFSLVTIRNAWNLSEEGPAVEHADIADAIATHVLADPAAFLTWRGDVVGRLTRLCPREESNPDGTVLPREILDPGVDLAINAWDYLIEEALRQLDRASNPFLVGLEPDAPRG